jgi:DNA-binding NtrC family response regulator
MCSSEVIDVADLPATLGASRPVGVGGVAMTGGGEEDLPMRDAVAALEKRMILRALAKAGNNRAEAARLLGIARPQLYTKMDEHGIHDPKRKKEDEA